MKEPTGTPKRITARRERGKMNDVQVCMCEHVDTDHFALGCTYCACTYFCSEEEYESEPPGEGESEGMR